MNLGRSYEEQLLFENEQITVYKWRLMPNESTGEHQDDCPQVVITLQGGTVMRIGRDGHTSTILLSEGKVIFQSTDAEPHEAVNISPTPIEAISIELLTNTF